MEFWVLTFFMKAPGTFNIKRITLHIIQNGNALDCFHLLRSDPISREQKSFRDAPKILVRANLQTVELSRLLSIPGDSGSSAYFGIYTLERYISFASNN